jgi:hypothetical protein
MHTILVAGGVIGTELGKDLASKRQSIRLVARKPRSTTGAVQVVAADVSDLDQTISGVGGRSVVYLLVGLKYDTNVWRARAVAANHA